MMYKTPYGKAITKVLQAYPPGASLIMALEHIVQTAIDRCAEQNRDKLAEETCEGEHTEPPRGVICRACYDHLEKQKTPVPDDEGGKDSATEVDARTQVEQSVNAMLNDTSED